MKKSVRLSLSLILHWVKNKIRLKLGVSVHCIRNLKPLLLGTLYSSLERFTPVLMKVNSIIVKEIRLDYSFCTLSKRVVYFYV